MATRYQVTCINKYGDHYNPHERIERVGGKESGGWTLSEDRAIQGIENREFELYVLERGVSVDVIVAKHGTRKYLKTKSDRYLWDNLLALPECPR